MSSTPKLTEAMKEKFPGELDNDSKPLEAGIYHCTQFEVTDSEKFEKLAVLDCEEGKFRTTSKSVVGSLLGKPGQVLNELIKKHGKVEIEIVPKKANTGRYGIALKAFP